MDKPTWFSKLGSCYELGPNTNIFLCSSIDKGESRHVTTLTWGQKAHHSWMLLHNERVEEDNDSLSLYLATCQTCQLKDL